jgi:hypothetical protein
VGGAAGVLYAILQLRIRATGAGSAAGTAVVPKLPFVLRARPLTSLVTKNAAPPNYAKAAKLVIESINNRTLKNIPTASGCTDMRKGVNTDSVGIKPLSHTAERCVFDSESSVSFPLTALCITTSPSIITLFITQSKPF